MENMKLKILLMMIIAIGLAGCSSTHKADKASESKGESSASPQTSQSAPTETAAAPAPSEKASTPAAEAVPTSETEPKASPAAPETPAVSAVPAATEQSKPQPAAEPEKPIAKEDLPKGPVIVPVTLPIPGKDFEMGKYEVTQAEWVSVMGSNPSKFNTCGDNCPVEKVSYNDVQTYIQKLNAVTGKKFRLPTEEEWEYACLGGKQSEFCGSDDPDAVAWSEAGGNDKTHPVGQKQANGYGLYDMSGNVMEWTSGCWEGNCVYRLSRGGSWLTTSKNTKVSYRIRYATMVRNSSGGFRLVLNH